MCRYLDPNYILESITFFCNNKIFIFFKVKNMLTYYTFALPDFAVSMGSILNKAPELEAVAELKILLG